MVKLNQESLVEDGLKKMRQFHQEYQDDGKGSEAVCEFLARAFKDEALLKRYLIGRKYRPQHAFDTLKSYAEARLEKYPEIFPAIPPPKDLLYNGNNPVFAVLKGRDSQGRRICYFEAAAWDPNKCTLDDLIILCVPIVEKLLHDEDCLNNGLIFIQETSGVGITYVKHYTLGTLLRFFNIYWYSFPLKVKGAYGVNVPSFFNLVHTMIRPLLPKKFKERLLITGRNRKFKDLHERISPDILPKCLGGNLKPEEANDPEYL